MLSRDLKELMINGVVSKTDTLDNQQEINLYSLTESGRQLDQVIVPMVHWGQCHRRKQLVSSPKILQVL